MFKALWFMIKVGLLVALVVWIADRPGFVRLEWLEYTFTIHVGLFLLAALAIILSAIFLYNVIKTFADFPASYRRYREVRSQEKGYEALTTGLTAVAAGDTKVAVKQAKLAEKYMPGDTGLPLLLKAQAARLSGQEELAMESFAALLEDKNAAFLGVRGLLQAALDNQDYNKALELTQHALTLHPKQPWIVRTGYDLHVRLQQWDAALDMLARAEKAKALSADQAAHDRVAILVAQSDAHLANDDQKTAIKALEKAVAIEPGFSPAATRLARLYNASGRRRKAVALIKKAWTAAPHPDLANVWGILIAPRKAGEALARMRWYEKLLEYNDSSAEGLLAVGHIALQEKLWGEARGYFTRALEIAPTAKTYHYLAALEERSGQGQAAAAKWMNMAIDAPPENVWVCRETGRVYEQWLVIAPPHGAFNTIEWGAPQSVSTISALEVQADDQVLDAPKASKI